MAVVFFHIITFFVHLATILTAIITVEAITVVMCILHLTTDTQTRLLTAELTPQKVVGAYHEAVLVAQAGVLAEAEVEANFLDYLDKII